MSSNNMKFGGGEAVNDGVGSESNEAASLGAHSGPITSFALAPGCQNCKALQMQVIAFCCLCCWFNIMICLLLCNFCHCCF